MATGSKVLGRDRWFVFPTDWAGYRALDKARGERSQPRLIYLDGRVTLVSPGLSHETLTKRLGWIVEAVLEVLDIPAVASRQTTLRKRERRGGVEGDESYYIANYARMVGKKKIDLRVDPPPDLAIEVVVSHPVKDALEVYRRLGVPEVWVGDGRSLRILLLQADGTYAESPVSASLPMLSAVDVMDRLQHPARDDIAWKRDLRRWVEDEIVPRHRQDQGR
jgi:Uma2 family endonuclease